MKRFFYKVLFGNDQNDLAVRIINSFILALILINVIAVILETVDELSNRYNIYFYYLELFSVSVFSFEYLMRVYTCTISEDYKHPFFGRIKFMFNMNKLYDILQ